MKQTGQKFLSYLILIVFGWVVYREVVGPFFFGATPPAAAKQTELTLQNAERMFRELGGKPGDKPVVVFVTAWCPVCRALEQALQKLAVPYARGDVEQNRTAAMYYQVLTRGRSNGVPLTVVGTRVFLGYDLAGIMATLQSLPAAAEDAQKA
jgi:glutaredoxin